MINKRYTIRLGLNYEIEEIIDHCKQDKQLNFWEFMTQVNEQDKAFKKLKKENDELKQRIIELKKEVDDLSNGEADWVIEEDL